MPSFLVRLLPFQHDRVHRAAFGRAAADEPLDPHARHEIERPLAAALDRLPAFDRQPQRPGHQGQFLQRVAAIRHLRRQGVVLSLVRERLVVECFEQNLDLLLEQFAVGRLVQERRAERLDFAGMIAAADTENDAPLRQDVDRRVILGEAERMPHRRDVEAAAEVDTFGDMREVERRHQHVRNAFHAFVLEMVLRHPKGVVARPVHQLRHRLAFVEDAGEMLVWIAAVVPRHPAITDILDVHMAGKQAVKFRDCHGGVPYGLDGYGHSGP
jgi:hypothetical protein